MSSCFRRYVTDNKYDGIAPRKVIDIGGADINSRYSYGQIFKEPDFEYICVDIEEANNVDVVLDDPYKLPFEDDSVDFVISGQMLEHCEYFWISFSEMARVVKPKGFIFLIAPSAGPIHRYPVDCYRFYPDAFSALAQFAGIHLIDSWNDDRGPWKDLVGVFSKHPHERTVPGPVIIDDALKMLACSDFPPASNKEVDARVATLDVMKILHEKLQAKNYLELGMRQGQSLVSLADDVVAVDPLANTEDMFSTKARLVASTSEDFFKYSNDPALHTPPDLVLLNGPPLLEHVLNDFMLVEAVSAPHTIVAVTNIFPNNTDEASRDRQTQVWAGDVWKLPIALKRYRNDLVLIALDTAPTGLLLIVGLKKNRRDLWEVHDLALTDEDELTPELLSREGAILPSSETFSRMIDYALTAKATNKVNKGKLRQILPTEPRITPKLSVVVNVFNMAREYPRTLLTLSPDFQDLPASAYEVIVVDNGSEKPVDEAQCKSILPNVKVIKVDSPEASPACAINEAVTAAQGDMLCIMIDGARMVSPRLLKSSLEVMQADSSAIVGTIAFHLGKKVQMKSVLEGYNQEKEDSLLASVPWISDGYRLFDISVFAGSSVNGWFVTPTETNALFVQRSHWNRLGGFDERFQMPGGGLANLDLWKRACELPEAHIVMLLGEGTFHQFHNGVATNSPDSQNAQFREEYRQIRGKDFVKPDPPVTYHGRYHDKLVQNAVMAQQGQSLTPIKPKLTSTTPQTTPAAMENKQKAASEPDKKVAEELHQFRKELQIMTQRNERLQSLLNEHYLDRVLAHMHSSQQLECAEFDGLSIIIVYYNIPKQIERTLESCSAKYQRANADELEVIIVDNGSSPNFPAELKSRHPVISTVIRVEEQPSPVFALNIGLQEARFGTVAFMIDGAHILTPGIFRYTKQACRIFNNPVISVPQYLLGSVAQSLSPNHEQAFRREQASLERLNWPENGYALFNYAMLPGEQPARNFVAAIESNCLITTKAIIERHGAFDERFIDAGGGFANLEIYTRLAHPVEVDFIMLAGEGSFHQNHDGVTTGALKTEREKKIERYWQVFEKIVGSRQFMNLRSPFLFGISSQASQRVGTISHEYMREKRRILNELSDIYIDRALSDNKDGPAPQLVLSKTEEKKHGWPELQPLGLKKVLAARLNRSEADLDYLVFLRRLHNAIKPKLYFEIGVHDGMSLRLSRCHSIGIDPDFHISTSLPAPVRLFKEKSDDFFSNRQRCSNLLKNKIDLAFIDGMHLIEYVVNDFANTEQWMSSQGVIVLDDVLPEQMVMAERERTYNAWCGDVYQIIPILRKYRPELQISVYQAFIGPYRKGIAIISGLDPANSILSKQRQEIIAEIEAGSYKAHSVEELEDLIMPVDISAFDQWLAPRES